MDTFLAKIKTQQPSSLISLKYQCMFTIFNLFHLYALYISFNIWNLECWVSLLYTWQGEIVLLSDRYRKCNMHIHLWLQVQFWKRPFIFHHSPVSVFLVCIVLSIWFYCFAHWHNCLYATCTYQNMHYQLLGNSQNNDFIDAKCVIQFPDYTLRGNSHLQSTICLLPFRTSNRWKLQPLLKVHSVVVSIVNCFEDAKEEAEGRMKIWQRK